MKKYLFLGILFFPLFAQTRILNIERYRLEEDTAKVFMLKTNAGLSIYNRSAAADDPVNLFGYSIDVNAIYYQVGYDNSISAFRNRFSNSTILNTQLTDRFSLTNTFELAYEDKPIVPITKLIYSFKTGSALNF